MPDNISGLRPVVRRVSVSANQKDLMSRFERPGLSTPSSSVSSSGASTPTSLVSRSRAGSLKKTPSPKTSTTTAPALTTATTTTRPVKTEVSICGTCLSQTKIVKLSFLGPLHTTCVFGFSHHFSGFRIFAHFNKNQH